MTVRQVMARPAARIGLAVLGLVLVYAVLMVLAGDKVPRGTTVEGVEIGGLGPAEAEARLRAALEPRSDQPIVVVADGTRVSLTPESAGLAVDYAASVERAGGGRSSSPARLWDYWTGGDDREAVLAIDDEAMTSAVAKLSAKLERKPVEGDVVFRKGKAVAVRPRDGVSLDPDTARAALEEQFLHDDSLELELVSTPPTVGSDAVDRAMREFAEPAMSAPVTLRVGTARVVVRPRMLARGLDMVAEGGELVPQIRARRLLAALEPVMKTVGDEPADATFRIVDGTPELVPARVGATLDPDDLAAKLPRALVAEPGRRVVEVDAVTVAPDLTTAEARKLGITERVSTFTTNFPYAEYRNVNLTRAAELIDGTLLLPGETFSLNETVGERTKANGFTEGYIIKDGLFRIELGGGVSQIATTTFNAMFYAGLEDVQHKPHSVYISRYPEGREATVAWPSVDLKFKNTTPYGIFITAGVDKAAPGGTGAATVSMYSTKYWDITDRTGARHSFTEPPTRYLDAPDCEASDGGPGFSVEVFRTFRRAGSDRVVRVEEFKTVYNPEPRLICGKKPAA